MFAKRWYYAFTLEAETPFHVGTGEFESLGEPGGKNDAGEYATIVRDHRRQPYLPATAIKGAIRALARTSLAEDEVEALFGSIKSADGGRMGLLLLRGGSLDASSAPHGLPEMPYAARLDRPNAFVAARTAIDGASGTAADHKLFFQEMAPQGLRFAVRATLLDHGPEAAKARRAWETVVGLLLRDGLRLGKSRTDGQGQFAIRDRRVEEVRARLDAEGVLQRDKAIAFGRAATPDARQDSHAFEFACRAPFLIVDSSRKGAGKEVTKEVGGAQVFAQRAGKTAPLLLGSSVSGVLRARATWIMRLMALRGELDEETGRDAVLWLFGQETSAGRVAIRDLSLTEGKLESVTSVKIDRFSGAPVHGALFTTEAFAGTKLRFRLELVRRGKAPSHAVAETIFAKLVEDVRANGLRLGHGTNKGFGWFESKPTAQPQTGGKHGAR